jgi:membrane protein YqaA with SNARE-associated domain
MYRLVMWVQTVLVPSLGPWGLLLAAFLDSSFVSIPEVTDLMVVTWSASTPGTAWIPIVMATIGSVAGSTLIFWLAVRGGEAALDKRFGHERFVRVRHAFDRWHLLTLAVPAMLPAPMPFKIFVLAAGFCGVSLRRFVVTVTAARGARYVIWSLLGMLYGRDALESLRVGDVWLKAHWLALAESVLVLALAGLVVRRLRRGARRSDQADLL